MDFTFDYKQHSPKRVRTYLAGVGSTLLVSGAQHVLGDRIAVVVWKAARVHVNVRHERLLQQVRAARPLHVAPPANAIILV